MLRFLPTALIAAVLAIGAFASPAQAQATRTWVSGVGDDANPCSRTAPCKTFAGAISKTAAGGEINCLDPAGLGAVTITKSISLLCQFEAGVLVSGTNGIVISALPTDRVVLEGLDIEGLGTGLDGVKILAGGTVEIRNCDIRHFGGNGVNMATNTSNAHLVIQNSFVAFNGTGIRVGGSQPQVATILDTTLDSNTNIALQVDGTSSTGQVAGVARSSLTNSPTGISLVNGGTAVSAGPSNLLSGGGAFSSTVPFK